VIRPIVLVSCVSKKRTEPALARDLYISPWFRKARAYAEQHGSSWYILSARYGLVDPDSLQLPYETTLNRMSAQQRKAWAEKVVHEICQLFTPETHRFTVLAGRRYREYLVETLVYQYGYVVSEMTKGMGIGRQLQFLDDAVDENKRMKAYRCIWSGMPDIVAYYAGQTASSARYNAYRVLDDIRRDVKITEISVTRAPEYDHLAQNKPDEHREYHISAAERGVDE